MKKVFAAAALMFVLAGAPAATCASPLGAGQEVARAIPAAINTPIGKTAAQEPANQTDASQSKAPSDAGGSGSTALLLPEAGTIIFTLIIFLLLLVVMGKWVWPKVEDALRAREEKLQGDFEEAERARDEAQKTLDEYKSQLAEARREAQQIVEKSRDDARRLAEQLKQQTQDDLAQMRRRMEADIDSAKEQAISEVYEQTATIATRIASRLLNRQITAEDQRGLVDESLKEFQALQES